MKKLFSLLVAVAMIISLGSLALLVGADYVPSVEFNDAPVIVPPSIPEEDLPEDYDPSVDEIKGVVNDDEGKKDFVYSSEIILMSLSDAYKAIDQPDADEEMVALGNALISAYNDVKSSVTDAIAGIQDVAENLGFTDPEFTIENIFNIGVYADSFTAQASLTLTFENNMDIVDGNLIVAYYANDTWVIVDSDKVTFDEKGLSVEFDEIGPIAFMSVADNAPDESTTTGDSESTEESTTTPGGEDEKPNNTWVWIVVAFVAVVVAGGVTVYVLWKKGIIRFKK